MEVEMVEVGRGGRSGRGFVKVLPFCLADTQRDREIGRYAVLAGCWMNKGKTKNKAELSEKQFCLFVL